jgi:hypothetical protein
LPAGSFSNTVTSEGTSDATVICAADESDEGAMAEAFCGVLILVEGAGRLEREGEERSREERVDWVMVDVWG